MLCLGEDLTYWIEQRGVLLSMRRMIKFIEHERRL